MGYDSQKVSDKLVLYIILDQDDSYNEYIAKNWPDIRILNDQSNFWHFAYAWKMHAEEVNSKLHGDWMVKNILNGHGKLMDMYASMGDGKMIEGELAEEQREVLNISRTIRNMTSTILYPRVTLLPSFI